MMSQGEIEALTLAMEKAARNLEVNIMLDIVRRIKANLDIEKSMTSSADYQVNVLRQMGYSDDYIKKQIQIYLKASDEEVDRLYNQTTANIYAQYEDTYDSMGKKQTPFGKHPDIQATVAAAVTQTKGTFQNISQTLGFTRIVNGKRQFLPTAKFFQKSLDEAILGVTTGAFSYDVALKKVIQDMTRSGLRTVEYASGRTYRVDSASRTALMTGFRQVIGHINEQLADDLDTDTYEVSYHIGARPTHQPWQGRVYPYKELQSVCGLGTVTGLCGANCYHWYEPFVPGISVRNYTDEELEDMVARENETTPYYGKEYNTYQALQYQRKMELTMRKYRQDIKLMKEGSLNELEIMGAKARYNQTMNEYVRFSKTMKLPEQRDRIYMDGLGRISTKIAKKSEKLSEMKLSIPQEVVKKAKLNQDIETKINQALKKLEKEYIIYLDSIEGEKLNGHDFFLTGAYLDKDGVLKHGIVFDYSIDYNKLEERIRAKHSDGYFAEKNYEDCIAHEIAHIIPFQNCTTATEYMNMVQKIKGQYVPGISKYADRTKDGRECLAEAFVRYRNGERIPDEARKLIEKYILPWRRK